MMTSVSHIDTVENSIEKFNLSKRMEKGKQANQKQNLTFQIETFQIFNGLTYSKDH